MKKRLLVVLAIIALALAAWFGISAKLRPFAGTTRLPAEAYLEGSDFASIGQLKQYLKRPLESSLPFQGQAVQVASGITRSAHRGFPDDLVILEPVALLFERGIWGDYFAGAEGFPLAGTLAEARTLLVFPPADRSPAGNFVPHCLFYDMETGESFHDYSVSYADEKKALPALLEGCLRANLTTEREESSVYGTLALRERLGLQDDFSGLLQLAASIDPGNIPGAPTHANLSELGYRLEDMCALVLAFDEAYQGNPWHPPTLFDALRAGQFSVVTGVPLERTLHAGRPRLMAFCSLATLFHDGDYRITGTGAYRATFRYDVLDYDTGDYLETLYQSLDPPSIIGSHRTDDYVFTSPDWWAAMQKMFPEEMED